MENEKKTLTVKELAQIMDVSTDTIKNCIKRIIPNKMQKGKTTYLDKEEIAFISKELKSNSQVLNQLTYEAGSQVKNTTTELEVIGNAIQAFNALQDLYNQKEIEYKKVIAEQKKVIDTIEGGKGCYSMNQTAKALKLPYGNITLYKVLRELNILNEDNTPKQNQIKNGNFKVVVKHINDKIGNKIVTLTTSKGIVYLAKKFNTEIDKSVKADF